MYKPRLKMNLQYFAEEITGVEGEVAAEPQEPQENTQGNENVDTGVKNEGVADSRINDEKDFAKAFKAREQQLEQKLRQEYDAKYGNYDKYSKIAEYIANSSGQDIDAVLEQIEYENLQKEAAQDELSPAALKRIKELETRIETYETKETQKHQQEAMNNLENQIDSLVENEGVDKQELVSFMIENQINNPNIAWKAMRPDTDIDALKQQAIDDYVKQKSNNEPVEKSGGTAVTTPNIPKNFEEANEQAMKYLNSKMKG